MQEPVFVGRERETEELRRHLEKTLTGQGQVCFITGQAGSGKTALVRRFVQQALAADPDLVVALGSCNAQVGVGDPYLPFREEERSALAEAVELEIGPARRAYVEGDEELYPTAFHIALAHKL